MKISKIILSFTLMFIFTGVIYNPISAKATNNIASKLYFIDLHEKGNATIIESQSGSKKIYGLIDTGTADSFEYIRKKLDVLGVTHLDFIILTHMHFDHVGGAVKAIDAYADSNTKLYLKDTYNHLIASLNAYQTKIDNGAYDNKTEAGIKEEKEHLQKAIRITTNLATRLDRIKKAASAKNVSIVKVISKASPSGINTIADIKDTNKVTNAMLQTNVEFTFGEYKITLYNGYDWNNQAVVGKYWNENVNCVTVLLRCTIPASGKIYTTYLGSDLGASSTNHYNRILAERTAAALGKKVSIYQVAHHGFYYSMSKETAQILDFKHAIVTTSYQDIADKGVNFVLSSIKDKNGNPITDSNTALSLGTNTIKYLTSSASLKKIYFTGGSNNGAGKSSYHIINALADTTKNYLNYSSSGIIKNGIVTVSFGSESMSVTQ